MTKMIILALFLLNCVLNEEAYDSAHRLVLKDEESKIDGELLTDTPNKGVSIHNGENIVHYEKEYAEISGYGEATEESEKHSKEDCNKEKLVKISQSGIYIVSGTLNGQLAIELSSKTDSTQTVTLVLNGININCKVAPGLIFYTAYEIDSNDYENSGSSISYTAANSLNFDNAGAKIIIADDSTNTVTGSHVAKCYEYDVNDDNTITIKSKKRAKYDGAFYSRVSISIKGETKGNGKLNIIGDNEGLDSEKHLLIESGNINIASQDDGINTNEDNGSVTLIKGGTLIINGGLGSEGDGIDSNGFLIINGGTVISAGKPASDSGMDADLGVVINGGNVVGVGSTMDGASVSSGQPTMNLKFSSQISKSSTLIIKDSSGANLYSFNPSSSGFLESTDIRTYQGAIISLPSFKLNEVYYLYLDDTQLGYSGQEGQNMPGNPQNNENNGNPGTPPENGGQNNNSDNPGNPPNNEGQNNNNNDNPRTQPGNGGPNNNGDNPGTPPNNEGNNNGQSTGTNSMTKEFTLTSSATSFSGVGIYTESSSNNSNEENSDKNSGRYIRFCFVNLLSLLRLLL